MKLNSKILLAFVMCSSLLTGCVNSETKDNISLFYSSMSSGDYETALNLTYLGEYEFITANDFYDVYTQYGYQIHDSVIKSIKECDDSKYDYAVKFEDGSEDIIHYYPKELGDSNDPTFYDKIIFSDIWLSDVEMCVVSDSKVTINGKEVPRSYIVDSDGAYDYYCIDALLKTEYEVVVSNDIETICYIFNPDEYDMDISELSEEKTVEILTEFQKTLNKMYEMIESNSFDSKLQSYLPDDYTDKDMYNDFIAEVKQNRQLDEKYTSYHDVNATLELQKDPSTQEILLGSYITSEIINLPVLVRINWIVGEDYKYEAVYKVNLAVKCNEDGVWKLATLNDDANKVLVDLRVE